MFSGAAIIGGGGGVTFGRAVTRGTRYYQNSSAASTD